MQEVGSKKSSMLHEPKESFDLVWALNFSNPFKILAGMLLTMREGLLDKGIGTSS